MSLQIRNKSHDDHVNKIKYLMGTGEINGNIGQVEIGITGPVGPQGIQGIQGIQSSPGLNGEQGAQGAQGLQGAQGIQGYGYSIIGHTGPVGPECKYTTLSEGSVETTVAIGPGYVKIVTDNAYTIGGNAISLQSGNFFFVPSTISINGTIAFTFYGIKN